MLSRKNILLHLVSAGILCAGFALCRYTFFDLHGMKQLPALLFAVGAVSLSISFFAKGKTAPVLIPLAYIVGFAAGVVFQTDGSDAGGARTNDLWIIWTAVFICLTAAGLLCQHIRKKAGR